MQAAGVTVTAAPAKLGTVGRLPKKALTLALGICGSPIVNPKLISREKTIKEEFCA